MNLPAVPNSSKASMNQSGGLKIKFAQAVSYPSYLKKEIETINANAKNEQTKTNSQQTRRQRRDRRLNIFFDLFRGDPSDEKVKTDGFADVENPEDFKIIDESQDDIDWEDEEN